jgi:hypothetical protein
MRPEPGERTRYRLRLAAFAVLAAFIVLGPLYRQVLHGELRAFRSWKMFQGLGDEICDVRYFRALPDGRAVDVDRYALLGVAKPPHAPKDIRRIESATAAQALARRLCERLPPDERDLRLIARCGSRAGWLPVSDGSRNICAQEPALEPRASQ